MIKQALVFTTFLSLSNLSVFGQDYPVNEFTIGGSANGIINGPVTGFGGPSLIIPAGTSILSGTNLIPSGPGFIQFGSNFAQSLSTRDRGPGGFQTGYTRNLNRWFGLTSNFSAYFSSGGGSGVFSSIPQGSGATNSIAQKFSTNTQGYNFEFGPQFRFQNRSRFTPYVRTLGGVAHTHASFDTDGAGLTQHGEDSRTGASLVFGGGVDAQIASRASVRLGADYNPTFLGAPYAGASRVQNNVRLNLGLVLHPHYNH
jgi:hypothetical protein